MNFLASLTMEQTNSNGNWCGTSHTLTIMGFEFSVHFEKHNTVSPESLYFNGWKGSYFDNCAFEESFGRIPTGYICLRELKEKFPGATITCHHNGCPVHRENRYGLDHVNTPISEMPPLALGEVDYHQLLN